MKKYIFAALTISFLYACNSKSEKNDESHAGHEHHDSDNPLDAQTKEMLAIHDSIMPHMDKLMDFKKQISEEVKITDSLIAIKSSSVLKSRKEDALKVQTQLENADKAMMNWMHEFKFDTLKTLDKTQAAAYVADQKSKIENVRTLMNKSLADADQFIKAKK